ncbi:hypothetical protein ACF0H5_003557 [Mactra antiquata]
MCTEKTEKMIFEKEKKSSSEIKCVIVGDGGVGKTSILMSYTAGGIMMDYIPTCFDCYTVDMKSQDKSYSMTLIDTAGQETYDRLRTLSYFDTDVFVVCFSVADVDSFENVKSKWIPEIKQYRPDTPFIIVGTQVDKRDISPEDSLNSTVSYRSADSASMRCVSRRKAKSSAKKLGAKHYCECSALRGEGVGDVISSALTTAIATTSKKKSSPLKSFTSLFHSKSKHKRSRQTANG